jgi:CSLREA domain-containing protein
MSARQRRAKRRRHGRPRTSVAAGAGLSLGAALGMTASAEAANFTVTKLTDTNGACTPADCSLREAIAASDNNNAPTADTILFASGLTGTITLSGTQLPTVDEPLGIVGPGARSLSVSGVGGSRILNVATPGGTNVTISGLTLRDGRLTTNLERGGAIFKSNANLTIRQAVISGNSTTGSFGYGGGIYSTGGSITIDRSTISANSTTGTGAWGGGVASYETEVMTDHSTISGNSTVGTAPGGGLGVLDGSLEVRDSTVSRNSAGSDGGGVWWAFTAPGPPDAVLANTIVAGNSASTAGPDLSSPDSTFQLSFSLVERTTGAPISHSVPGSNLLGQDPLLRPLADTGGTTPTHALSPLSPALDRGSSLASTDQRGRRRPLDLSYASNSISPGANASDIGAFELDLRLRCRGRPATIAAGPGVTRGTRRRNVIVGVGGRNVIRAGRRSDLVCGRGGNDLLVGGTGADRVLGQAGNDVLRGGPGRDRLLGGKGRDRLLGGPGRDMLLGGPGRDRLRGGPGRDLQRQ